jgi:hypothetical protein
MLWIISGGIMIEEIVNLQRYPLHQLDSDQGKELVSRCRADLERDGLFNLEEFMLPDAVRKATAQAVPVLKKHAFTHRRNHNIYFLPMVPELSPEHPALKQFETTNHTICSDQIPGSVLVELYLWSPFAEFLALVMSKPRLYVMDDLLARLNVMAYRDGEALNWHFDRSEFTTTLLLQAPEKGGEFLYRTDLRSDTNPNYEGIGEFLLGDQSEVTALALNPGTLNVFRGKNTLHRVSPVQGSRERIITVLSYYEEAGVRFSAEEQVGFYGRKHA